MGLQQTLDRMKQEFAAKADPEILTIMKNATENLLKSGILDRTLKIGSQAPDFELKAADGNTFHSRELRQQGPLLLTFYRGVW